MLGATRRDHVDELAGVGDDHDVRVRIPQPTSKSHVGDVVAGANLPRGHQNFIRFHVVAFHNERERALVRKLGTRMGKSRRGVPKTLIARVSYLMRFRIVSTKSSSF